MTEKWARDGTALHNTVTGDWTSSFTGTGTDDYPTTTALLDDMRADANWAAEHRAEHAAMVAAIKGHRDAYNGRYPLNSFGCPGQGEEPVEEHRALLDAAGLPATEPAAEADSARVAFGDLVKLGTTCCELAALINKVQKGGK